MKTRKVPKLVAVIFDWLRRHAWMHHWHYRNPFNRTCTVCGRHESEFCTAWAYQAQGLRAPGWWEVHNEGDVTKHY